MDDVFKALADPSRRKLLDELFKSNGQTLGKLCEHLDMTRHTRRPFSFLQGKSVSTEAGVTPALQINVAVFTASPLLNSTLLPEKPSTRVPV